MKKFFCFIAALCCFMSLCACHATDPENAFGQDSTVSTTAPKKTSPNLEANLSSLCSIPYNDRILFTASASVADQIFEYDPSTGEVSPLCKDATCKHDEKGCNSANVGGLEPFGGKLYGLKPEELDPDAGSTLVELKDGRFVPVLAGDIHDYCHAGDSLFVKTADNSLLVYENGSSKPRTLLDEYRRGFIGVSGSSLYGDGFVSLSRVDLTAKEPVQEFLMGEGYTGSEATMKGTVFARVDRDTIYYGNFDDFYLRKCNLDGSSPELALDMAIAPASLNCDDPEYLYFASHDRTDHHIYRAPKSNPMQTEAIAELPLPTYCMYVIPDFDLLLVQPRKNEGEEGALLFYAVKADGSGWSPVELPDT